MYVMCATTAFLPRSAGAANPITNLIKPGDVISGHAEFEKDCQSCHTRFKRESQSSQCRDCHEDIDADLISNTGYHGHAPDVRNSECRECHTDHEGRDADIAAFDHQTFQHYLTDFPLLGAHSGRECSDCHVQEKKFRDAPSRCFGCHSEDDKHHGELGEDCAECHTQKDWTEARFDHDQTDWPLLGRHETVECGSCHVDQKYADTPTDCVACHREDDLHRGQFGRRCDSCHVPDDWDTSVFDHKRDTGYALEGGHRQVTCTSCHEAPLYEVALDQACQSCHLEDDVHDGLRGHVCANCHVVTSWTDTDFDHFQISGFDLLGKHSATDCESCHTEPADTVDVPEDCFGCHEGDDPHRGQEGPLCENCHNEKGWDVAVVFDHSLTAFPLFGKHQQAECDSCHETQAFKDAPSTCFACHEEDDYHDGSLGTECAECHTPDDWTVWQFDHAAATGYALSGAHEPLVCAACHADSNDRRIAKPATECFGCHAQDDVHFGEFGRRCERCHTTENFYEPTAVN